MEEQLTLENIKARLYDLLANATAKVYYDRILKIKNKFPSKNLRDSFINEKKIIDWIETNPSFKTNSTKRAWLSAYLFVLSEFSFPVTKRKTVSKRVQTSAKKSIIDQRIKLEEELVPLKDAEDTFEKLKVMYDGYKEKMGDKYDTNRMYAAYLHIILNYGAIRLSELVEVIIMNGDSKLSNFINREKKVLIIRDHKNVKYQPIKEIILDDEFMKIIKPATNALFFTGKSGNNLYNTADGLSKRLAKEIGYGHYDLRKMKSSIAIANGNIQAIEKLERVQGHSLATQLNYYNKYSKKASED